MTELKITDALKLGIEAHKAGKIQKADQYYTAILKVQPNHPDANHNLGILAVSVNKIDQAIPLFKKALETNPKIPQFWLSFIEALLKDKKLNAAQKAIIQAKENGIDEQSVQKFQNQLTQLNNQTSKKENLENTPSTDEIKNLIKLHKNGETKKALKKTEIMLQRFPESVLLFNISGACHFSAKNYDAAIEKYKKAIDLRPDYADAHNNIANVYKKMNMDNEAFSYYKKCIKLDPDHKDAYTNLGLLSIKIGNFDHGVFYFDSSIRLDAYQPQALIGKGHCHMGLNQIQGALICFKRALDIDGENIDAFLNLATAYKEIGKFERVVENYDKAFTLENNHIAGRYNFGNFLNEFGDFAGAIESYKKVLEINPLYSQAWNALSFPIIADQKKTPLEDVVGSISCREEDVDEFNRLKAISNYQIHAGGTLADKYFEQATHFCNTSTSDLLINPNSKKKPSLLTEITQDHKKIIALTHFGRSGTGMFHSLIDGHSSVSTLPSIYFSEFFDPSNWKKIISGGWANAIDKFMTTYDVLFDANSLVPIQSRSGMLYQVGKKEGMANLGIDKNEVFSVDRALFKKELEKLLYQYKEVTSLDFFHLVHTAYNLSIGDTADKSVIFYHIHNPTTSALVNFSHFSSDISWVMMVREPLQCCESWLAKPFAENEFFKVANCIQLMFLEIDNIIYTKRNAVGVKLEDIKNDPRKTLSTFCKWMGVKEEASLYEMSAQGKKWWGDPSSKDFEKDGMDPFGKTSINREVGSIFSKRDQFLLQTLFYPFSLNFGYVKKDTDRFKSDLATIRPMLNEMFDFERTMAKNTKLSDSDFMSSGSFHLLRATLKDRWNILNTHGTYPNLIKPLN